MGIDTDHWMGTGMDSNTRNRASASSTAPCSDGLDTTVPSIDSIPIPNPGHGLIRHVRAALLVNVSTESTRIARLQGSLRSPVLDVWFMTSSFLGADTFFLVTLPLLFFFGLDEVGRGLLIVLALGGYASSFLKDLLCIPRPFAPPVTRLTVLNHHLEYGFPSTHTTHASSIVLYFLMQGPTSTTSVVGLLVYGSSVIFGRVYLGMHTFTDCAAGIVLGASAVGIHRVGGDVLGLSSDMVGGLGGGGSGGILAPILLFSGFLLLLELIPMPDDACPCHDDAVQSGAVALGAVVGKWVRADHQSNEWGGKSVMPGSGWSWDDASCAWKVVPVHWPLWLGISAVKVVVGMTVILVWRIFAKTALRSLVRWLRIPPHRKGRVVRERGDMVVKVLVYAGIAFLSCEVVPMIFVWGGLGVRSSPFPLLPYTRTCGATMT